MNKNKLFVKAGCPFSYKFIVYLNEINKLGDFELHVAHADEESYEEITMYILEKSGQKASFPTVESSDGIFLTGSDELIEHFSSVYNITRDNIEMLKYWENNMMPRMRNIMKQLREAKEKITELSA
jgi:glutaredoxin